MPPDPVPPPLQDLEDLLARRLCPEPEPGLRARVLAAVQARAGRPVPKGNTRAVNHIWGAAAALVLAVNVALSVANSFRSQALPVRVPQRTGHTLHLPPVGPPPGTEMANQPWPVAASAVAQLAPAPDAGEVARCFFELQENESWLTSCSGPKD